MFLYFAVNTASYFLRGILNRGSRIQMYTLLWIAIASQPPCSLLFGICNVENRSSFCVEGCYYYNRDRDGDGVHGLLARSMNKNGAEIKWDFFQFNEEAWKWGEGGLLDDGDGDGEGGEEGTHPFIQSQWGICEWSEHLLLFSPQNRSEFRKMVISLLYLLKL